MTSDDMSCQVKRILVIVSKIRSTFGVTQCSKGRNGTVKKMLYQYGAYGSGTILCIPVECDVGHVWIRHCSDAMIRRRIDAMRLLLYRYSHT